jgi:hypothetical protein
MCAQAVYVCSKSGVNDILEMRVSSNHERPGTEHSICVIFVEVMMSLTNGKRDLWLYLFRSDLLLFYQCWLGVVMIGKNLLCQSRNTEGRSDEILIY